jgi:hypothetical protein
VSFLRDVVPSGPREYVLLRYTAERRDQQLHRDVYLVKISDPFATPLATLFRRGDTNADGELNLTDPVTLLNVLFAGGGDLPCADAGDNDDSGALNVTDPVYLLNHLLSSGPAPVEPFAACGVDPTDDELECVSFEACTEG